MSTEPMTQDQANPDEPAGASTPDSQTTPDHDSVSSDTPEASHTAETALHQLESELAEGTDGADSSDADSAGDSNGGGTTETTSESTDHAGGRAQGSRQADLEHEGEVAADFLEQLLDIADLDGDLEVNVEGDRAAVAIVDSEDGPAPKRLVGRDGVVLESLQELTRLAVQAETGDRSRLMLDIAGHRAGRRAELVDLARSTVASVKETGERAELEPMSAFERKVVHDEVLAGGLVSESEGTEPNRYVVILPQD